MTLPELGTEKGASPGRPYTIIKPVSFSGVGRSGYLAFIKFLSVRV
jgi:hypothetical protein